jgi:membrane fusion protein, copper/silver efflux system
MKKAAYLVVLVASVAVAFAIGSWTSHLGASPVQTERSIHHYACPMHPTYTSQHPGTAPCCGMPFAPVYEDAQTSATDMDAPPGTVHVPATIQQTIGLQVSEVRKAGGQHTVRLFGRVAADEQRVHTLNAGIDGTILDVSSAVTTGSRVRRNQQIATYTAPDFLLSIQAYLLAVDGVERRNKAALQEEAAQPDDKPAAIGSSPSPSLVVNPGSASYLQQRLDRLHLLGMSDVQIAEVRRTREVPPFVKILSPVDGIVLARAVSPGLKFGRGDTWFRVADLRHVWIVVDAFGDDATSLRPGMEARVTLPGERRTFTARVSDVPPQYNPDTRTRTVRLEAENLGDVLRPDMSVDVEIATSFAPTIAVPSEAVLDSGLRRVVYVERISGSYEPRQVETGWRRDGQIEIVGGLVPGDRIVVSGTFLVDSDSRMRLATGR